MRVLVHNRSLIMLRPSCHGTCRGCQITLSLVPYSKWGSRVFTVHTCEACLAPCRENTAEACFPAFWGLLDGLAEDLHILQGCEWHSRLGPMRFSPRVPNCRHSGPQNFSEWSWSHLCVAWSKSPECSGAGHVVWGTQASRAVITTADGWSIPILHSPETVCCRQGDSETLEARLLRLLVLLASLSWHEEAAVAIPLHMDSGSSGRHVPFRIVCYASWQPAADLEMT